MGNESFLSKYFTDGHNLTMNERIWFIVILATPLTLILSMFFILTHEYIAIGMLILHLSFIIPISIPYIFRDYFEKNYGLWSKIHSDATYQYSAKTLPFYVPFCIILILELSYFFNKWYLGINLSISFIIPCLILISRNNIFHEKNCLINDEIVFGYPPHIYGIISLIMGLFGIFNAFRFFYSDFNYFVICLIVILLFQLAIVNPDVMNKVLPFEIRRKKGFLIFISCFIILYLIIIFFMCGSLKFIPLQIDLTPWGILRKIIIYGLSIILVIQFYKLSKKMNKKE
ncbi:hypothetical protein [Methanobrevibacter sp.]|uniref:hypothetical protein n=1 Tax=Methanobrevibacter sp. TaxID=66852 RepID=UPI00386D360E